MSASAVAVMKLAGEEAERLGQDYIDDEHVLLGLLAKRVLHLAALQAGPGRDIGPEQLLYGVLRDIADPAGTQMSRRGRAHLAQPGRRLGGAHPALLLLRDMGVDPDRLRHRLASQIGAQP